MKPRKRILFAPIFQLAFGILQFHGGDASSQPILCEAEEFRIAGSGWKAQKYGGNYYAGTFANTFLSRKAFLGAPEQCERSIASMQIAIPASGRYLALVRYEAAYRFETRFRLRVEQRGRVKLDRLYGARENIKVWPFGQRLTNEVAWSWGASENIVWEGHDAVVELEAGSVTLSLIAERQPEPAARRNVDVVMLTADLEEVQRRIQKENYLPLDGLLTQSDDLYLKLHNAKGAGPITVTIPNGTEHSPYWVHQRQWKPKTLSAGPGDSSDWLEVGSLLDSLNDGQWQFGAKGAARRYALEFAVKTSSGIKTIRRFDDLTNDISLAYDANTRYSKRIQSSEEVLTSLVEYLKNHPVHGVALKRTLIFGNTFPARPNDPKYTAALNEFLKLMGATALSTGSRDDTLKDGLVRGYIDVRDQSPSQLEASCQKLSAEGRAERIAVVSLGDEISLASPPGRDHTGFRAWLRAKGLQPAEVDPAAGNDWDRIAYSGSGDNAREKPTLFYYSELYRRHYGSEAQKQLTDIMRRWLPNALVGVNYSPHHGHFYLGDTHQWVSLFREGGMTMPWSEDYIFQVPVGSQQMNFLSLDLFRAGIQGHPEAKIQFYVMPHWPGNTPASWRRQFYGDLAHGAKILNLFEFRPVQAAYTENHCSSPEMYQAVRQTLHELGLFEDIIQDGQVRRGIAGLWFSETADIWNDNRTPFDMAKRTLYIAIRHQQLPLDVVVEGDNLTPYQVIYLTDQHVSRAAAEALAAWVRGGGRLFVTAGGGMFDEFNQPNQAMRELLGVEQQKLIEETERLQFEKQDLPFARPLETVRWRDAQLPIFGVSTRIRATDAKVEGRFSDDSPAVTLQSIAKGSATYCSLLPGLTYFKPALPVRPVDRSSRDDSSAHFIPTRFDPVASRLIGSVAEMPRPIQTSEPLVETTLIEAKQGTVISFNNWSAAPIKTLQVTLNFPLTFRNSYLASGHPVRVSRSDSRTIFTMQLDVADALILRR